MVNEEVNAHHICVRCGRQFIDVYSPPKGYSDQVKQECLKAYVNGEGFGAIERSGMCSSHNCNLLNLLAKTNW
jgi:transposase-like protein